MAVAAVSIWFDTLRRRRLVITLWEDLTSSVCDLIQNLEQNRERTKVIDNEFLEIINAEIIVYGRNREHLAVLPKPDQRSQIREFFTRVASLLAQIQWRLRQFYDVNQLLQTTVDPHRRTELKKVSNLHLEEAHIACDRLRETARDARPAHS